MTKKCVLIDIDNTIAKTQIAYVKYANSRDSGRFFLEKITKEFNDDLNDEFDMLVHDFIVSTDYESTVGSIEPYESVAQAFSILVDHGYEICVASSRIPNWHEPTVHWLDRHGLLAFISRLYLRSEDTDSLTFKNLVARSTGAVSSFDDSPQTALGCPFIKNFYLIDQPWNRNIPRRSNIIRMASFYSAVYAFLDISPNL